MALRDDRRRCVGRDCRIPAHHSWSVPPFWLDWVSTAVGPLPQGPVPCFLVRAPLACPRGVPKRPWLARNDRTTPLRLQCCSALAHPRIICLPRLLCCIGLRAMSIEGTPASDLGDVWGPQAPGSLASKLCGEFISHCPVAAYRDATRRYEPFGLTGRHAALVQVLSLPDTSPRSSSRGTSSRSVKRTC